MTAEILPASVEQPELLIAIDPELKDTIAMSRQTLQYVQEVNANNLAARPTQQMYQQHEIQHDQMVTIRSADAECAAATQAADETLQAAIARAHAEHEQAVLAANEIREVTQQAAQATYTERLREVQAFYTETKTKESGIDTAVRNSLDKLEEYVNSLRHCTMTLSELQVKKHEADSLLTALTTRQEQLQVDMVENDLAIKKQEAIVSVKRLELDKAEQDERKIGDQLQGMTNNNIESLEHGLSLLQTQGDIKTQAQNLLRIERNILDACKAQEAKLLKELGGLAAPMVELRQRIAQLEISIQTTQDNIAAIESEIRLIAESANQLQVEDDTADKPHGAPRFEVKQHLLDEELDPQPVRAVSAVQVLARRGVVSLNPEPKPALEAVPSEEQAS